MTEQLSEYFYFHCKEVICPFCLDPWPEYVCTKKNLQNIHFFQRKLGHLLKKSMVMQCKSSLTICMWNECRLNVNTDMILLIFNFVLTKTVFYTVFIQFFVFLVGWGFFLNFSTGDRQPVRVWGLYWPSLLFSCTHLIYDFSYLTVCGLPCHNLGFMVHQTLSVTDRPGLQAPKFRAQSL